MFTDRLKDPKTFIAKVNYLYRHERENSSDNIELVGGRVFSRYSSPIFGLKNEYFGRIWYFRDISANVRAKEQAAANESKFRAIFETQPIPS